MNDKFYDFDISFIDELLGYVGKNDCVISHMLLEKYGVLKIKDSRDITRKIKSYKLVENYDYIINPRKVAGVNLKTKNKDKKEKKKQVRLND